MNFQDSFSRLEKYIIQEKYKGYDPYDTLNSWIPFQIIGKWGPIIVTQFQKRNPINIRPILGINKDYNPKAMGLFLHAYSILYQKTQKKEYLQQAHFFYNWLINNYSTGYSGICWGYNFPWATPAKYIKRYTPSSVVTGTIIKGINEYYKIAKSKSVADVIASATQFINQDLKMIEDENGLCISYTPINPGICYNASLLGAEVLAIDYFVNKSEDSKSKAISAVEYVINNQKQNGVWAYSKDIETGTERIQTDFHQGYIIESIYNVQKNLGLNRTAWNKSIKKGLKYYKNNQFTDYGRSFWRLPKEYPIDIHNQAQGIITFKMVGKIFNISEKLDQTIASWTVNNMQDDNGYFYYQKFKNHTNKIPYMRWSQAWMFLALSYLK